MFDKLWELSLFTTKGWKDDKIKREKYKKKGKTPHSIMYPLFHDKIKRFYHFKKIKIVRDFKCQLRRFLRLSQEDYISENIIKIESNFSWAKLLFFVCAKGFSSSTHLPYLKSFCPLNLYPPLTSSTSFDFYPWRMKSSRQ